MRLAYGKLGRSIPLTLDDASNVGGDIEVVRLLHLLLGDGHEVHLVGRNRPNDFYHPKLVNHWQEGAIFHDPPEMTRERNVTFENYDAFFRTQAHELPHMDAWIIWLGQHGSSLHPVPVVMKGKTGYTNPMASDVNYGYPLIAMVNELGVRPHWLCPDPRNMIKFRDLWSPNQRSIHAQFNTSKDNTFYDERDDKLRTGGTRYHYAGIELLAVSPTSAEEFLTYFSAPPERLFGLLVNEGYSNLGSKNRVVKIKSWVGDKLAGTEIFGHWCDASQRELQKTIVPVPLADVTKTLRRWRATMTFPATGTGWATAKPWECFNTGCICFKHPEYDSQGHIYNHAHMMDALGAASGTELYKFLCPPTHSSFHHNVEELRSEELWRMFAARQYEYLQHSLKRLRHGMGPLVTALEAELPEVV